MEGIDNQNPDRKLEVQAEKELDNLLNDPRNSFLNTIPVNRKLIDNANSAIEALAIARARIQERYDRTFHFEVVEGVPGVTLGEINSLSMAAVAKEIFTNGSIIGSGGDADVLISRFEASEGVEDVCYKFSKQEQVRRGRNSTDVELELQSRFLRVASQISHSVIGVPVPYYFCEIGNQKIIAMERLHAKSVSDILRRKGNLPVWFDEEMIDVFCDDLKRTLDLWHKNGLYHRDMHTGNIMISQSPEYQQNEKVGYIIDFGLSAHVPEGFEPYRKDATIGEVFTYADDYGRIESVRNELKTLRNRVKGGV